MILTLSLDHGPRSSMILSARDPSVLDSTGFGSKHRSSANAM